MKVKDEKTINRRTFLKTGALSLAGMYCFSAGLKEALAKAKASGKLLLTEANLNNFFTQKYQAKQIKETARDINRDIVGWLKREFSLTELQEKAVGSVSSSGWAEVKRVLKVVEEHGVTLNVKIIQRENKDLKTPQSTVTFGCSGSITVKASGSVGGAEGEIDTTATVRIET